MRYFVTGATGFIGKRLVKALLARRGAVVHFLVRPGSVGKLAALYDYWGVSKARAVAVTGDLTQRKLGVAADDIKALKGQIDHLYHLAAVYDLEADAQSQVAVNVDGTRHMVEFARAIAAGHVHHVSSIAAAGMYEGVFREDMFDEAEGLEHPYFMTKHESEKIVRQECKQPWTVYRPAAVVGDSTTGEMDKIDGPYYFFKLIQRMRQILPPWMPSVGLEGGRINIVPVDFVVAALDHISHQSGRASGQCFHLVDPEGHRVGDVLDIFSRAAHAPKMNLFVNAALLGFIPRSVKKGLMALAPVRRIRNAVMKDLGLPDDMFTFINFPTRYDRRELDAVLKGSGIECPDLNDYAWVLWDYWERKLDPDLFIDRSLRGTVAGKVVLVTGGSSGIGLATAHKFAEAGATTLICGRDQVKLDEACAEAKARGYAFVPYAADIADMADCDRFVKLLIETHGGVDFLVNNSPFAGKDGKFVTSRQLRERLERELQANVALKVEFTSDNDTFIVSGRGELHLTILLETMRREGYEMAVGRPRVVMKEINGERQEPYELLTVDVEDAQQGAVMEELGRRKGDLQDMQSDGKGRIRLEYRIPARGLIGFQGEFLTLTRGTGLASHIFDDYGPLKGDMGERRNGVLISQDNGAAVAYALWKLQDRGRMFVSPGDALYEGMVIGIHSRDNDLIVNPIKGKQLTNVRSSGTDEAVRLVPPIELTLEKAVEFIADDELVEITPKSIRLRKRYLIEHERKKAQRMAA